MHLLSDRTVTLSGSALTDDAVEQITDQIYDAVAPLLNQSLNAPNLNVELTVCTIWLILFLCAWREFQLVHFTQQSHVHVYTHEHTHFLHIDAYTH